MHLRAWSPCTAVPSAPCVVTGGTARCVAGSGAPRTRSCRSCVLASFFFFSSRRRHTRLQGDWSSDVCSSDLFDLVLCLGVLQHTPSPEDSILALWTMVKPGGQLVIDHYTWTLSRVTKLAPLYRVILKRLPPATAKRITDRLVDLFFPLHWALRHAHWAQMLLSRVSPCLAYCHFAPELTRAQHDDWCRLDTFDQLTDHYQHLRTTGQVRRALAARGADSVEVWRHGSVVEARCRKPDGAPGGRSGRTTIGFPLGPHDALSSSSFVK